MPFDLSLSVLRSVSPVHLQYLRNMDTGIQSSMSISIVVHEKLWGLIVCHHYDSPRYLPYVARVNGELLGLVFSSQIAALASRLDSQRQFHQRQLYNVLYNTLSTDDNWLSVFAAKHELIMKLFNATGMVIVFDGVFDRFGLVPSRTEMIQLDSFLIAQSSTQIFSTDSIAKYFPAAKKYSQIASGVLSLVLSPMDRDVIFFFRQQQIETVEWAGNPHQSKQMQVQLKPGTTSPGAVAVENAINPHRQPKGSSSHTISSPSLNSPSSLSNNSNFATLAPRNSFDKWSEQVEHHSLPWSETEINTAQELRRLLLEMKLKLYYKVSQNEATAKITVLEGLRKQQEYFTDSLCHEIRNPINGILGSGDLIADSLVTIRQLVVDLKHIILNQSPVSDNGRIEFTSASREHSDESTPSSRNRNHHSQQLPQQPSQQPPPQSSLQNLQQSNGRNPSLSTLSPNQSQETSPQSFVSTATSSSLIPAFSSTSSTFGNLTSSAMTPEDQARNLVTRSTVHTSRSIAPSAQNTTLQPSNPPSSSSSSLTTTSPTLASAASSAPLPLRSLKSTSLNSSPPTTHPTVVNHNNGGSANKSMDSNNNIAINVNNTGRMSVGDHNYDTDLIAERLDSILSSTYEADSNLYSIGDCARHQLVIANDVLFLSKMQQNKVTIAWEPTNIISVVASAIRMHQAIIKKKKLQLKWKEEATIATERQIQMYNENNATLLQQFNNRDSSFSSELNQSSLSSAAGSPLTSPTVPPTQLQNLLAFMSTSTLFPNPSPTAFSPLSSSDQSNDQENIVVSVSPEPISTPNPSSRPH